MLLVHLMGNPIVTIWSLLDKAHCWSRSASFAEKAMKDPLERKSLTVIMAAAAEVSYDLDYGLALKNQNTRRMPMEAAATLIESRRNNIRLTALAIAIYVFQVVAAFVPAVGASASPSGGRIATAMLLSWLIPAVLFSNIVGDFGSPRNCKRMFKSLMERIECLRAPDSGIKEETKMQPEPSLKVQYSSAYFHRPNKIFLKDSGWVLALLSTFPIAIAFITAFSILITGPTYFSCRHILIIGIAVSYLVSAISNSWISFITTEFAYHIILLKDNIIGITTLALLVASSCGLFNTCYCWSGALVYGQNARAPLNPTGMFDRNDDLLYPLVVAACLFLQMGGSGLMVWSAWRGFRAIWWTEEEIRAASER